MAHYAEALLYLVPVAVAGIVAFVVTRPEKDEPEAATTRPTTVPPQRRAKDKPVTNVMAHPTLMHAALSTHLTAVGDTWGPAGRQHAGAAQTAGLAASVAAQHAAARLVSIRKPARIPRRPVHRCPHKP